MKKNILVLWGGGGTEHEVSEVSSGYVVQTLKDIGLYNIIKIEITHDHQFKMENGTIGTLNFKREFVTAKETFDVHYIVPCIHGPPGETGEIQTFFEFTKIPYMGCGPEAGQICFNKVTSKLWFNSLGIPNTPFAYLTNKNELEKAYEMFDRYGRIFIKASSQGSSVGCFQAFKRDEIKNIIEEAFKYSQYVLVERMVDARELEISTYEYNGDVIATLPGEIICPDKFYSYEEKYNNKSKTTTALVAPNLSEEVILKMREYAKKAFIQLKLRHLSRIDFFYTKEGEIFLNEINTFPGMTPISMFPKMLENHGHSFKKFIADTIAKDIL